MQKKSSVEDLSQHLTFIIKKRWCIVMFAELRHFLRIHQRRSIMFWKNQNELWIAFPGILILPLFLKPFFPRFCYCFLKFRFPALISLSCNYCDGNFFLVMLIKEFITELIFIIINKFSLKLGNIQMIFLNLLNFKHCKF